MIQPSTLGPTPEPAPTSAAGRNSHGPTIRIALAGCGTVGGALVRLLRERERSIRRRHGIRFDVVRVLVRDARRPRDVALAADRFTTDPDAFLATESDIVVEATGGPEPAGRIARAALTAGRSFVTANKALVAAAGAELDALARRHRAGFAFEAAVGGGVPVIRTLRDALAETEVRSIRGVLNGTTNFILSRLHDGARFDAALADAQRLGFAEADPSRDLDGRDAADKIRILAWLAFGVDPATVTVERRGILPDPDRIAADARAQGLVPRLVARCVRTDAGAAAVVEPVALPPDAPLALARGAENVVEIETRWNGTVRLSGPGAGGAPTASAVLGDVMEAAVRRATEHRGEARP
ncbi:MAG TPA: homoserine dehydrogenase [Longimicrobiales bacterium]